MINIIFNVSATVVFLILLIFIILLWYGCIKSLILGIKDLKEIHQSNARSDRITEIVVDVIATAFFTALLLCFFLAPFL